MKSLYKAQKICKYGTLIERSKTTKARMPKGLALLFAATKSETRVKPSGIQYESYSYVKD
jgi:hypothetical protein